MSHRTSQGTILALLALALMALLAPVTASAVELEPSNWFLASGIGRDVNRTKLEANAPQEERNECTTASKEQCARAVEGGGPREFSDLTDVAVSPETGDVYIADNPNHRVQVLGPEGRFLFMFGWNVNRTNVGRGAVATQQEKNLCGAESHDECGPGEVGDGRAGQFEPGSLAIDPSTGDVYVLDERYARVQEFTAAGEFALMIGAGVNKKGGTVCTKAEEPECEAGIEGSGKSEFKGLQSGSYGDRLTVGPSDHLLYVGDEGRVQKFEADGKWAGEISLAGLSVTGVTRGVAVDKHGDVFVTDSAVTGVHEYNQAGEPQSCVIHPEGSSEAGIRGIALDAYERLGVLEDANRENAQVFLYGTQGAACGKSAGDTITLPVSNGEAGFPVGLAYSSQEATKDRLYLALPNFQQLDTFDPASFPEATTCASSEVLATSAVLCGTVNPNGISTTGFFKYGPGTSLALQTPNVYGPSEGALLEPVSFKVTGLVPDQTYRDETFVQAEVGGVIEDVGGEPAVAFHTPTPAPEIPGEPSASDVSDAFALLSAQVNPEHAPARYSFQYGLCPALAGCATVADTPVEESSVYGSIAAIQELTGLQPQSTYSYRLVADNQHEEAGGVQQGGETIGAEGHFTTGALPVPGAQTGAVSAVGSTSAVISGTVNPDGQPATYAFELGLYNGAGTRFGVVLSGAAGASSTPVAEALALSGLQPGSTYAYRIAVKSGYGEATGATMVFTTEGLPAVLAAPVSLAQLPVPSIAFPALAAGASKPSARKAGCAHPKGKQRRCAKSKPSTKHKRGKASRRSNSGASRSGRTGHDQHKHG